MGTDPTVEFDRVWQRWREHKDVCVVCRRGHGTCEKGRPLRDATLAAVRSAQAYEGA